MSLFDEFVSDHLHGDKQTKLDIDLLKELKEILINPSLIPSEILKSFRSIVFIFILMLFRKFTMLFQNKQTLFIQENIIFHHSDESKFSFFS